jgi:uncharacterized protein with HEPN domain
MKKFDDTARLGHIFDAICRIESYVSEVDKPAFLANDMMQDAVVRQLEIIGEAARNISDDLTEKYPKIPWFEMRAIRNKIVHDYLEINTEIIWDTINNDLPSLKPLIENLLGD